MKKNTQDFIDTAIMLTERSIKFYERLGDSENEIELLQLTITTLESILEIEAIGEKK